MQPKLFVNLIANPKTPVITLHITPPPTMTDFRALCAELLAGIDGDCCPETQGNYYSSEAMNAITRARAALDEPEMEGPTPIDYRRWHDAHSKDCNTWSKQPAPPLNLRTTVEALAWAKHCLARWGRPAPAPKPIPVSERLPEDADCLVIPALSTNDSPFRYCWIGRKITHCSQALWIWDWAFIPLTTEQRDWPFLYWLPASTQFLPTTVDSDQPT